MRSAVSTSTHRSTDAPFRVIFPVLLLFGLLAILAGWQLRYPSFIQASQPVLAGYTYSQPQSLTPLDSIVQVNAFADSTCALTSEGGVKCWGYNGDGQLGDGTVNYRSTPVDVVGLEIGVSAVAVGGRHACALTTAGGVKCWGVN